MLETLKLLNKIADNDSDLLAIDGVLSCHTQKITINATDDAIENFNFCTNLKKFYQAYTAAGKDCKIDITPAGKIKIANKTFRALLPNKIEDTSIIPEIPCSHYSTFNKELTPILKVVAPFMGDDFMRPWLNSVLIKNEKVYATTNPVAIQAQGNGLPDILLPGFLVKLLLSTKLNPWGYISTDNSLFLKLDDTTYLRSSLFENKWPDIDKIIDEAHEQHADYSNTAGMQEKLKKLIPLCPDKDLPKIYLDKKGIHTEQLEFSASCVGDILPETIVHADNLVLVLSEATSIDFTKWPKPMPWKGDNCRGLLLGLR